MAAASAQHRAVFEREGMLVESAAAITFDVMQNRKRLRDAGRGTVMSVLDAEVECCGMLANRVRMWLEMTSRIHGVDLPGCAGMYSLSR